MKKSILFAKLLITLTFSLKALPSYAAKEVVRESVLRHFNGVSAETAKGMNSDELTQLSGELFPIWAVIGSSFKIEERYEEDIPDILTLGLFELEENVNLIQARLRTEIRKPRETVSLRVIEACLTALGQIGATKPDLLFQNMVKIEKSLYAKITTLQMAKETAQPIREMIAETMERIRNRNVHVPSLQRLLDKAANSPREAVARLQRFEKALQKKIIGQGEAIKLLVDIEWRSQLYKNKRTKPEVVYLTGSSGTGKDTIAHAWADSLNPTSGGWEEHLFSVPVPNSKADLWQIMGSVTGYVGTENMPKLLVFLVEHSGGKYEIQEVKEDGKKTLFRVIENPEFKGEYLPGFDTPDQGIVFFNQFQNWPRSLKDAFKEFFSTGKFVINNPNGGLNEIYVPVKILLASNEGDGLIIPREANGQRRATSFSFESALKSWERIHDNKQALRNQIMLTNGKVNSPRQGDSAPGISADLLAEIPDSHLILLRPLSPENLRQITAIEMNRMARDLRADSGFFASIELSWTDELIDFVQGYDYDPETNAKPIGAKIKSLIEAPLMEAVRNGQILINEDKEKVTLHLDVIKNSDNTRLLAIDVTIGNEDVYEISVLIDATKKDIPKEPISDERIAQLVSVPERIKKTVFGIDDIAERIGQRILTIENEAANGAVARPVNTMVLMGPTSVGKSELSKALAKETGNEIFTLDFSQIQTLKQFQDLILGTRDADGNGTPSEFMKRYDENHGRVLVLFDELANVRDMNLLKALYDFFREPVLTTFSDGKARSMGAVIAIVTGNVGQELYTNVPRDIPMVQQMSAWEMIWKQTSQDLELQRSIMEKTFPAPLLARWDQQNIFFIGPHSYKSLRQLAQLKLQIAIDRIAEAKGRRHWNIVFASPKEYSDFVTDIVDQGFYLHDQGASIDNFMRNDFEERLKFVLLKNLVPDGSTVVIESAPSTGSENEAQEISYHLYVEGKTDPLVFGIKKRSEDGEKMETDDQMIMTGYHEAGHSLMMRILFSSVMSLDDISIIPGITKRGDQWIRYLGIAGGRYDKNPHYTRDFFINRIAVLAAGGVAETLVSRGEAHSAGVADDLKRESAIAQEAILRYGMSEVWGHRSIPDGMKITEYVANLSNGEKELLAKETKAFIEEGRSLAERFLKLNFANGLAPLAIKVVEEGRIAGKDLNAFMKTLALVTPENVAEGNPSWIPSLERRSHMGESILRSDIPRPSKIADIQKIAEDRKKELFAQVPAPEKIPVGTNSSYEAAKKVSSSRTEAPCGAEYL